MTIGHLASGFEVAPLVAQIDRSPDVWNRHTMRTEAYETPHSAVSDIWVRYNAWEHWTGDVAAFNGPHVSSWYPVADEIPAVRGLVDAVVAHVGGGALGGVLITRIPAGGEVKPHVDHGWHAGYYEKFAVQLKGDPRQAFCFEDSRLSPDPGDLYTFDNSKLHWVTNDSDAERITLICCIRRQAMLEQDEMIPFDMYFASLASMQVHPGAGSKEHKIMTLEECKTMALEMVAIRREQGGR